MDELKEIEGLLEQVGVDEEEETGWRKYVKLVVPHVALVMVVVLYAVVFAFVFYSIESPHEMQLKADGLGNVLEMRELLLGSLWNDSLRSDDGASPTAERDAWQTSGALLVDDYIASLHSAYSTQFLTHADVRGAADVARRRRRRAVAAVAADSSSRQWTRTSSLFFTATTMATIGYGNIVPVTSTGRVICVFFALFGAPLAIITIGDLGKFLSECTIWFYRHLKKVRASAALWCANVVDRWRGVDRSAAVVTDLVDDKRRRASGGSASMDWENFVMDKTQVPVLLVFAILLAYIALGAFIFAALEQWTYVDSFYFCFITLTTVGFGDIVPEEHQYLPIMLLYIGFGLAVTTMCIDLVGIQYIQKIHYFGRKFRGTDLLQLLKRRRMIERRLAMGQGEEILQMYFDQMEKQQPSPVMEDEPWEEEWPVDNVFTYETKSRTPSPLSLCSSVEERSRLFRLRRQSRTSWSQSGPDPSFHCSLSTDPSVHERVASQHRRAAADSPLSFLYEFPWTAAELARYAEQARLGRRVLSCPKRFYTAPPTPIGLSLMQDWDSYIRLLEQSQRPYVRKPELVVETASSSDEDVEPPSLLSPPHTLSDSLAQCSSLRSSTESMLEFPLPEDMDTEEEDMPLFHKDVPVYSADALPVDPEHALQNAVSCPVRFLSREPPTMVTENYCFIVDSDNIDLEHIIGSKEKLQFWKPTSKSVRYYFSDSMKTFYQVNIVLAKGKPISARRKSRRGVGLASEVALKSVFRVSRFFAHWRSYPHFHRIVSNIVPIAEEGGHAVGFASRTFVQYLWRENRPAEKQRVSAEYEVAMRYNNRRESMATARRESAGSRGMGRTKSSSSDVARPPPDLHASLSSTGIGRYL